MRRIRDTGRARKLRASRSDAEHRLWQHLRDRRLAGLKFRRQHPIDGFFVDFYCAELGMIIELDGSQHLENAGKDASRTQSLERCGRTVLRFWNNDVLARTGDVLSKIALVAARRRKQ